MDRNSLILAEFFCSHHNIDLSFINSLEEVGLIDVIYIKTLKYISKEQLKDIEIMIDFHYNLDINIEGIDAISNLLKQIRELQKQLITANNKLRVFEVEVNKYESTD